MEQGLARLVEGEYVLAYGQSLVLDALAAEKRAPRVLRALSQRLKSSLGGAPQPDLAEIARGLEILADSLQEENRLSLYAMARAANRAGYRALVAGDMVSAVMFCAMTSSLLRPKETTRRRAAHSRGAQKLAAMARFNVLVAAASQFAQASTGAQKELWHSIASQALSDLKDWSRHNLHAEERLRRLEQPRKPPGVKAFLEAQGHSFEPPDAGPPRTDRVTRVAVKGRMVEVRHTKIDPKSAEDVWAAFSRTASYFAHGQNKDLSRVEAMSYLAQLSDLVHPHELGEMLTSGQIIGETAANPDVSALLADDTVAGFARDLIANQNQRALHIQRAFDVDADRSS